MLLLAATSLVAGAALLAVGARAGGGRRAGAVLGGALLVGAPLVEAGARLAVARGLAGPSADRRGGDRYADDVLVPGSVPVPRHALPAPDRRPGDPHDSARILALGDSFTHGEGVRPDEAFAARLAALVHPADGRPVEVVNLGISGLDARDEHDLFLGHGQALSPDVLVWTLVPNDLGGGWIDAAAARYDDLVVDRTPWDPSGSAAWDLLAVGLRARRLEAEVVASYRASFSPVALDGLEAEVRDVAEAVHARGGRLLVVTFPLLWRLDALPFADLHAAALARARAAGAEVLDLGPVFAGRDEAPLWTTPRDHHPSAAAHAIAAEAIAAAIGADVPRATSGPCRAGAGDAALAACASPGAHTALAWARALTSPRSTGRPPSRRLAPFALAWAWIEADALPAAERDAVRAEVGTLASR